jgi:hypothetical protein
VVLLSDCEIEVDEHGKKMLDEFFFSVMASRCRGVEFLFWQVNAVPNLWPLD